MISNPEETLTFFSRFAELANSRKAVFLEFKHLEELTPDAMLLLISFVLRDWKAVIQGDRPQRGHLDRIWRESGFHEALEAANSGRHEHSWGRQKGFLHMKSLTETDSEAAGLMVDFAWKHLEKPGGNGKDPDQSWQGVQSILVEVMGNVVNHADGNDRESKTNNEIPWWALVYCDDEEDKARFCFLDNGVGIYESFSIVERWKSVPLGQKARLIRKLLDGEVRSSTGKRHRGEGFPNIKEIFEHEQAIENLIFVTNDVYADVGRDDYRKMTAALSGTFIYWEKRKGEDERTSDH